MTCISGYIDLVVIILGYLDKITNSLTEFRNYIKSTSKISYSIKSCDYIEKVSKVTNSIFFSGSGTAFLTDYDLQRAIAGVDPQIPITFAVSDTSDKVFLDYAEALDGTTEEDYQSYAQSFNAGIKRIKSKREANIITMDLFVPILISL